MLKFIYNPREAAEELQKLRDKILLEPITGDMLFPDDLDEEDRKSYDALGLAITALRLKDDYDKQYREQVLAQQRPYTLKELHGILDTENTDPIMLKIIGSAARFPAILDRKNGEIIAIMGAEEEDCFFNERDYGLKWCAYPFPFIRR